MDTEATAEAAAPGIGTTGGIHQILQAQQHQVQENCVATILAYQNRRRQGGVGLVKPRKPGQLQGGRKGVRTSCTKPSARVKFLVLHNGQVGTRTRSLIASMTRAESV